MFDVPILHIVYNRPDLTKVTFAAVRARKPQRLFVAADGPSLHRLGDHEQCQAVRNIYNEIDWDCDVHMLFRDDNLGCKRAVSSAITWFFEHVEEGIILEDDTVPSEDFFDFSRALLAEYRNDPEVSIVSGDNFQFGRWRGDGTYYFSKYVHIWGWATWRRAWQLYDLNMTAFESFEAENRIANVVKDPLEQAYWKRIFRDVYEGRIDTWDYQLTFASWLNGCRTILPNVNLVSNIGFDGRATHTRSENSRVANLKTRTLGPLKRPSGRAIDDSADAFTFEYLFLQKLNQDMHLPKAAIDALNAGQTEEAVHLFGQAIEAYPEQSALLYGKAVALARHGEPQQAIATLDVLLEKDASSPKAKMLRDELAQSLITASGASSAVSAETAHLARQHFDEGAAALERSDLTASFDAFVKAKALRVPMRGLDALRAQVFLKRSQVGDAIEALREELRNFPSDNEAVRELLAKISEGHPKSLASGMVDDPEFRGLLRHIQAFTMLSEQRLYSLFTLARHVCEKDLPGHFVECGVAGGGSTAMLSYMVHNYSKRPRLHFACDSFEGMPEPTERDMHQGSKANDTGWGTGTCAAPIDSVRTVCERLGVFDIVRPIKGFFEDTLPKVGDELSPIAMLHMDADWYASTKVILDNLYDRVVGGGVIQIDDYGHWDGCREAVHEFAAKRGLRFELRPIDGSGVWMIKS